MGAVGLILGVPGINGKSTELTGTPTQQESLRPSRCFIFLILITLISSFRKIMEYISFSYLVASNKNQHEPT